MIAYKYLNNYKVSFFLLSWAVGGTVTYWQLCEILFSISLLDLEHDLRTIEKHL